MHFIMDRLHNDPMHGYLYSLDNEEQRLTAVIGGVTRPHFHQPDIYRLYLPIYGWLTASHTFSVTFEQFRETPRTRRQALGKVIDYLEVESITGLGKDTLISSMESKSNPRTSKTFRRGEIGSWRKVFTAEHKLLFKNLTKDFLVRLGYEKNNDW